MAKGRKVTADQNSEELDQLRRCVHSIMIVLENAGNLGGAATTTPAETFQAIADAISSGLDSTNGSYVGTGIHVEGMIPQPKHPRRPRAAVAASGNVVDLDQNDL